MTATELCQPFTLLAAALLALSFLLCELEQVALLWCPSALASLESSAVTKHWRSLLRGKTLREGLRLQGKDGNPRRRVSLGLCPLPTIPSLCSRTGWHCPPWAFGATIHTVK